VAGKTEFVGLSSQIIHYKWTGPTKWWSLTRVAEFIGALGAGAIGLAVLLAMLTVALGTFDIAFPFVLVIAALGAALLVVAFAVFGTALLWERAARRGDWPNTPDQSGRSSAGG
jgi:hypothetical protein